MTPEIVTAMNQMRDALVEIRVIRADAPNRVKDAFALGMRKEEIHQLSGVARTTIDRWLGHRNRYEGGHDG